MGKMPAFKNMFSYLLFATALAANSLIAPWGNAIDSDDSGSRFHRTAMALQTEPDEVRASFVEIALMQMIEVYLAESDLARDEAGRAEGNEKLSGWVVSVDAYTDALLETTELVQAGAPVELVFMDGGAVAALTEGKLTILAHPRAAQQSTFESNVLNFFCADRRCAELTTQTINAEPIAETQPTLNPHWIFNGNSAICQGESGSISIEYQSQSNLSVKRSHCKQLLAEIRLVVAEMIRQSRHGVELDWSLLALSPIPQSTAHLLRFNELGDSSVLSVPVIYASGNILWDLRPWFEARLSGAPDPTVDLLSSEYDWHFSTR
jgi:hypothetical protein